MARTGTNTRQATLAARVLRLTLALGMALTIASHAQAACTAASQFAVWNGTGDFFDAAHWVAPAVGPDIAGNQFINSGAVTISSSPPMAMRNFCVSAAATVDINAGTIVQFKRALNLPPAPGFDFLNGQGSGSAELNNDGLVRLRGNLFADSDTDVTGQTLDFNITGNGRVALDGGAINGGPGGAFNGPHRMTIGAGQTISGAGTINAAAGNQLFISNAGTILADQAARTLLIYVGGNVDLNQGALPSGVAGRPFTFNNGGAIGATNGGTLNLVNGIVSNDGNAGGVADFAVPTTGAISTTNGGIVRLTNVTLTSGSISGDGTGAVENDPAGGSSVLDNLAIQSGGVVRVRGNGGSGAVLKLRGTITNNGIIQMQAGENSVLNLAGGNTGTPDDFNVTLTGHGRLVLTEGSVVGNGVDGRHLRNDVDHTIEGAGTLVASSFIENQGLITANANGKVLRLIVRTDNQPGTLPAYNSGVLKAENGGILSINPSIGGRLNNQGGTIMAASGSQVAIGHNTTIDGGTLTSVGNGFLSTDLNTAAVGVAALNNVTLTAGTSLHILDNGFLTLSGTTTNNGVITFTGSTPDSRISVDNGVTATILGGNGRISLTSGHGITTVLPNAFATAAQFINDVHHTIDGAGYINNYFDMTNRGTIAANTAGETLSINALQATATVTNAGVLKAENGGTLALNLSGSFNNDGGIITALANSTVTMDGTTHLTNLVGTTLSGGSYRAVGAGATINVSNVANPNNTLLNTLGATTGPATEVVLDGVGSGFNVRENQLQTLNSIESSLNTILQTGSLRILNNRDYTTGQAWLNRGTVQLGGGTLVTGSTIRNSGTIVGYGTVANLVQGASGTVRASGGTLTLNNGLTGIEQTIIDPGATLVLGATSDTKFLTHNGAGLVIAPGGITVINDYINSNGGPRANVTGGPINAASATQTLSGAGITNGGSATPTLDIGTMRVGGSTSRTVTVNNGGTSTTLRGAVDTSSASGITTLTPTFVVGSGGSSDVAFNFTASAAGSLSGQTIGFTNNFDNVADQLLAVTGTVTQQAVSRFVSLGGLGTLTGSGSAYDLDLGTLTSGSVSASLGITNDVIDTLFNELLSGTFDAANLGLFSFTSGNIFSNGNTVGLEGGQTSSAFGISFSGVGQNVGDYTGTLRFLGVSQYAGLSDLALNPLTLTLHARLNAANGNQVPEPSTIVLLGIGVLAIRLTRRQQANRGHRGGDGARQLSAVNVL